MGQRNRVRTSVAAGVPFASLKFQPTRLPPQQLRAEHCGNPQPSRVPAQVLTLHYGGVGRGCGVGRGLGVALGVAVGVGEGVIDGVAVGVAVGVTVAVGVGVGVGVGAAAQKISIEANGVTPSTS